LEHYDAFPAEAETRAQVLIVQMDEEGKEKAVQSLFALRKAGIRAVLFPDVSKLKKQMKYAADTSVDFVILAGEEERSAGEWTVRNMQTGEQDRVKEDSLVAAVQASLSRQP
jgi:histidyl-tRNA synthetase